MIVRILLLLLSLAGPLCAQPWNFLSYSISEGLAQSQVFALCEDSRGYLWCGTQGGGASRFDGHNFQNFGTANGLPNDFVNTFFEDSRQRLWMGSNSGFAVCERSRFIAGFKNNMQVNAICETAGQHIWLGTSNGIFAYDDPLGHPQPVLLPELNGSAAIQAFLRTPEGVWAGTSRGVFLLEGAAPIWLNTRNGLPSNNVSALALDHNNQLWIALTGYGIVVYDIAAHSIRALHREPDWPSCLQADAEGNMWVGTTNNGVLVFDHTAQKWLNISENEGLPHNHVRDLLLDRNGQMWVASSGGGIARILNRQFRHFTTANGLAGNRIYALHQDARGRIWMAVSQNGVQMFDENGFHRIGPDSSLLMGVKCKTIASDRKGRIWMGTDGRGIFLYDSSGMQAVDRLPTQRIQRILLAPNGDMWVAATDNGLLLIREDAEQPLQFSIRHFNQSNGLIDQNISTLKVDGMGRVWFGTQSGILGYCEGEKIGGQFGGGKNGLPALPVNALCFDHNGKLWVASRGGGIWGVALDVLLKQPGALFEALPANVSSNNAYLLLPDHQGKLWIGTAKGVDEVIFGDGNSVETHHYGKNEGFLGIETCQDAALCDRDGNLWFGTMNGLTRYSPSTHGMRPATPVLHFQEISLFYKPLSETKYEHWVNASGGLRPGLELEYDENHLSFEFCAVDLANPEGLRYCWRLNDAEWSPLSDQHSVNFAGLAPGDYHFSVQAVSAYGARSEIAGARFSIRKPYWQSWWFQLAGGGLLLLLIFAGLRSRVRQIKRSEQEKREKLEVQHRLLQLEQKAMQLQMNPHFIFNALNSVQSLVSSGDANAARTELNAFAQLMRAILSNSRKQWISLKEETDTLAQYLRIEQFCRPGKPFDYDIRIAPDLDPESVELPPMLLQPFVENAVLHGIAHLNNRKGKIDIEFTADHEWLVCSITDNGVGREKAALLRPAGHESAALHITRERLDTLAPDKSVNTLEITDVYGANHDICGTRVTIRLPLKLRW